MEAVKQNNETTKCIGTILGPKLALLPAHCVTDHSLEPIPKENITVLHFVGDVYYQIISVKDILIHEHFSTLNLNIDFNNDIALLHLEEQLNCRNAYVCAAFPKTSSYFLHNEISVYTDKSLCAITDIHSPTIYSSRHSIVDPCILDLRTYDDIFCISNHDLTGNYAPLCQDDIGAPLIVVEPATNKLILIGIIIHLVTNEEDAPCASPLRLNIALKIYQYWRWIQKHVSIPNQAPIQLATCEW